jgi:hypothetical protein
MAVFTYHRCICDSGSGMEVISRQQRDALHCSDLRLIHRCRCFNDDPLVFGFRRRSDHRDGYRGDGRKCLRRAFSACRKKVTFPLYRSPAILTTAILLTASCISQIASAILTGKGLDLAFSQ